MSDDFDFIFRQRWRSLGFLVLSIGRRRQYGQPGNERK
jgi:hypothetical protein